MLFKEYPYNGRVEYQIIKEIQSNKKLKNCDNEKLNDLLNKILKINMKEFHGKIILIIFFPTRMVI